MADDKFWEQMGGNYYRDVMKNMGAPSANADVQFGMGGTGVYPNYQVISESGERSTFRGSSHKADAGLAEKFKEEKISDRYTYAQVRGLLSATMQRSKE